MNWWFDVTNKIKKINKQNLVAEIGWRNGLFVWAEQDIYCDPSSSTGIVTTFSICRIYGGVMGIWQRYITLFNRKWFEDIKNGCSHSLQMKKKLRMMETCQKINPKFLNFSNYVRPFWTVNHVPSSQVEKRVRDLLWEFLMIFCCTAVNLVFLR